MRGIAVVVEQGQQVGLGEGDKVAGACEDLHHIVVFGYDALFDHHTEIEGY